MSRTYSIGCKKCLESLWIGQGWPGRGRHLYTGEPSFAAALQKFLFDHEGHDLIFVDDEDIFASEGQEYTCEEYLAKADR